MQGRESDPEDFGHYPEVWRTTGINALTGLSKYVGPVNTVWERNTITLGGNSVGSTLDTGVHSYKKYKDKWSLSLKAFKARKPHWLSKGKLTWYKQMIPGQRLRKIVYHKVALLNYISDDPWIVPNQSIELYYSQIIREHFLQRLKCKFSMILRWQMGKKFTCHWPFIGSAVPDEILYWKALGLFDLDKPPGQVHC